MPRPTADEVRNAPLITSADIEKRVDDLIGRAITRKLWLLLLDADRIQLPLLMPIDHLPAKPHPGASMGLFLELVCGGPVREVIGVLERRGGADLTSADRGWLQLLAAGLIEAGLGSAGMVLSHTKGARWLPADEWT